MNQKVYEFDAVIRKVDGIDGAYIEFPWDVREEFGRGRVLVSVEFDGVAYQGSLVWMGTPGHIVGVRTFVRKLENSRAMKSMFGCRSGSQRKSDDFTVTGNTTKAHKCRL